MSWYYLSFAGDKFLGAALVEGASGVAAIQNAHRLGCNPGGAVRYVELPAVPPAKFRNRLLTREEAIDPELARWGQQATRRAHRPGADILQRPRRRRRRARA